MSNHDKKVSTYKEAGVDRELEEKAVSSILDLIKLTHKNSIIPEGHYAGSIKFGGNLLSLATDGVGSKVILAQELDTFDTIGIDAVAMNVNDLICNFGTPSFFLDYYATGKLEVDVATAVVSGIAEGCPDAALHRERHCPLTLGGRPRTGSRIRKHLDKRLESKPVFHKRPVFALIFSD